MVAAIMSKCVATARMNARSGAKSDNLQTRNRLARQGTRLRRRSQATGLSISAHGTDIRVAFSSAAAAIDGSQRPDQSCLGDTAVDVEYRRNTNVDIRGRGDVVSRLRRAALTSRSTASCVSAVRRRESSRTACSGRSRRHRQSAFRAAAFASYGLQARRGRLTPFRLAAATSRAST